MNPSSGRRALPRPRRPTGRDQIVIGAPRAAEGFRPLEAVRINADRNASLAVGAGGAIGKPMAAAKSGARQTRIQIFGILARQFGDDLSLHLAVDIGAGQAAGAKEKSIRLVKRLIHASSFQSEAMPHHRILRRRGKAPRLELYG